MPRSTEGFLWTPSSATEGLETDAVITRSPDKIHPEYDVLVIGAGFTGLVAARDLSHAHPNKKLLIVEARDRIGGRTWTAKAMGEEFEMGGTWVHWNQPHMYSELHRYNQHRNLKSSAGTIAPQIQYFKPSGGKAIVEGLSPKEAATTIENVAADFFSPDGLTSRDLMPYPHDPLREPNGLWKKYDHLTIGERLGQLQGFSQRDKDLFESNFNTLGSATGKDIGFVEALRWYALGGHSVASMFELAGIYKIGKGGMTSLAREIFKDARADILPGCIVTEISQNRRGVVVKSKDSRTIRAKMVISTIPLNCLSDITFNPPLSAIRREVIHAGHINQGAKIHFKLKATEPGWFATCSSPSSSATSSPPSYVFAFSDHNGTQDPSSTDGTYCIGFGYNGKLTDKKDSGHIIRQFQQDIRPGADVQAYLTHDWMNDPFAKGTWSCWGPGYMTRYLEELQKPHGKVFFASADWADGWRGFVDGAIERGRVAARVVGESLEVNSLQGKL